jgi:putative membrane-bound dehydrogenase-like protein
MLRRAWVLARTGSVVVAHLTFCYLSVMGSPPDRPTSRDGNCLTYLDDFCEPYYVHRDFPRLTTPAWVGRPGVEAVVVLAIDDMRDTVKYEQFLRPILERLKRIGGRAPLSIMTNQVDPADPQLQEWLKEGVSIEVHTVDHPCPCLQGGDFEKAKSTCHRCIDLMASIPGNRPVAFRMPCCDSQNTPSPRAFNEILAKQTSQGHFLTIDSSVFHLFTPQDPSLDRAWVVDDQGRERFRKYVPFPSFVNTIEDYPYPYVIGHTCWELPCMVPSDWEAQNIHQPNNPQTVEDLKIALDATVAKQGVFDFVFHPHGWIRADQVVQLVDHAVARHGSRVEFLSFRQVQERLDTFLVAGGGLKDAQGSDRRVRLLDVDGDTHLDVIRSDGERMLLTRIWRPEERRWDEVRQEIPFSNPRFGILDRSGRAAFLVHGAEFGCRFYQFDGRQWRERELDLSDAADDACVKRLTAGEPVAVRLRDIDGNGLCELILSGRGGSSVLALTAAGDAWRRLAFPLPGGARLETDEGGDAGLRFCDINQDGADDVLYSDADRYGACLFRSLGEGWSWTVLEAHRAENARLAIPPFVRRDGSNHGAFFHSRHVWVQNEDTYRLPDGVDRISLDELLAAKPPPKDPRQSLDSFLPRAELAVELVASEPLIADPVAFDWTPDGRLYVVEMVDYPLGRGGNGQSIGGRVKLLKDTDGDGVYDRADLFLDRVLYPTGVKVWRQGVLVTAAPEVFYAEDRDGDGKADHRETLYVGFGEGNQQHRVNGLRWGLDNWVYLANGDSGGTIRSVKSGETLQLASGDLRIRPDQGLLERQAGRTQSGRNCDDWGTWFGGNNSHPVWQFLLPDQYVRRNPFLTPPPPYVELGDPVGAAPVYPRSRTLARFNDFHMANRFTSCCSPEIYRDSLLGATFAGDLFVCEPAHNLVHRRKLIAGSIRHSARRADDEQRSEFLASSDNWFRPTMVRTGPDGALWIADMYRLIIEHPEYIPEELARGLDFRAGDLMGRIYRVVPRGKPLRPMPRLDLMSREQWVDLLTSPNGWQRDMAQQLLIWNECREVEPRLTWLATDCPAPLGRLHALATLDGLGLVQPAILRRALKDLNPSVRRHAVRLAEPWIDRDEPLSNELLALAESENDPQVILQLALSLGQSRDAGAATALASLAARYGQDQDIAAAVLSSLHRENITPFLNDAIQQIAKQPAAWLVESLRLAAALQVDRAIELAVRAASTPDDQGQFHAWQFTATRGILDRVDPTGFGSRETGPGGIDALENVLRAARQTAGKATADGLLREEAIRLLPYCDVGRGSRSADGSTDVEMLLVHLTGPHEPPEIQSVALEALSRLDQERIADHLLSMWPHHSPHRRAGILDLLVSRSTWSSRLLTALERGDIRLDGVDTARRQQLTEHTDAEIRRRALELFGHLNTSSRQPIVDRYLNLIGPLTGASDQGGMLFTRHCSGCHRFDGAGHAVGPDLAAVTNRSIDTLLPAILDPNRSIEGRYEQYSAVTVDGRVVTGVLETESTHSVTLVGPDGRRETLLRDRLETIRSTGRSMMPEGMENELTPQDVADLIAYLQRRPSGAGE